MPSVAQELVVPPPSKKRRRDDADGSTVNSSVHLYEAFAASRRESFQGNDGPFSPRHCPAQSARFVCKPDEGDPFIHHDEPHRDHEHHEQHQHHEHHEHNNDRHHHFDFSGTQIAHDALLPKKILPLPANKRIRVENDYKSDDGWRHPNRSPPSQRGDRRRISGPYSRQNKSPSAMGPCQEDASALQQTSANSRPTLTRSATSSSALAPCYVCVRRPTKKSDLDSFADCEGCGQRTCYVCMRECLGWGADGGNEPADAPLFSQGELDSSFTMEDADEGRDGHGGQRGEEEATSVWLKGGRGHRQMVCSRCCVEQGVDGDVVCLGCLQRRGDGV